MVGEQETMERNLVDKYRRVTYTYIVNRTPVKVNFIVREWKRPSGLMSVGWRPGGEEVGIKLLGTYYKNAGSIIWTGTKAIPQYGWALSSEDGLWSQVNTLGYKGKSWRYNTADGCMLGLIKYVEQCLTTGNLEWK